RSAYFDLTYKTRIPPFLLLPFYFILGCCRSFNPNPSTTAATERSTAAHHPSLPGCPSASLLRSALFLCFRCIRLQPHSSLSPFQVFHSVHTALGSLLLVISSSRSSSTWFTRHASRFH
ncbi:hypothetical protein P152DRAFT_216100, partial [Eremomyces bilateralis CBS 781.70]